MNKYVLGIIFIGVAFAVGRYSGPVKETIRTVEVEKKQTEAEKDKHKETRVKEVVKPDGTKETTTEIVEDTNTKKSTKETTTAQSETEKIRAGSRTGFSVLGGTRLGDQFKVDYGVSVDREFLGPLKFGAFFFQSGVVGLSLGLNF